MCNFGRGHYEEHLCDIILNLDQWFTRCLLKIFSYQGLWWPFSGSVERNHLCNFGRGHYEVHFESGPMVQEEILFKDISYLEFWWPFYSAEWNHLCNFGRGHHEEPFCEIILHLDQ